MVERPTSGLRASIVSSISASDDMVPTAKVRKVTKKVFISFVTADSKTVQHYNKQSIKFGPSTIVPLD